MKKLLLSCFFSCALFGYFNTTSFALSDNLKLYTASPGDSYWSISNNNNINFFALLKLNNKNQSSMLNIGDTVFLPASYVHNFDIHNAVSGDSYFKISKLYNVDFMELLNLNNANLDSKLNIGDVVILPRTSTKTTNYISYTYHTVVSGDTLWSISNQYGIPLDEVLTSNNLSSSSVLDIGMILKIPVHNIAKKGDIECLDWNTEANYVLPVNSVFKVIDYCTKKSFYMKRTTGRCHADCEPLTSSDTQIIKEIWGGNFSWDTRPILVEYNGRTLICSMSSFPHAGLDSVDGGIYTNDRSGNYGYGYNFDWVKDNNCDGVMDIHFLNSTRHSDGKVDPNHQSNISLLKSQILG